MKTHNLSKYLLLFPLLFFIISCTSSQMKIAEYNFDYMGNDYTVRSAYCPNNPASCNKLIGNNFIAIDLDQDRVIDKIDKGNISLQEAQEIYDYCLESLEKQGKINEVETNTKSYSIQEANLTLVVQTFVTNKKDIFNEFTILNKVATGTTLNSLYKDGKADGILNVTLKGGMLLEEAQTYYDKILKKGLDRGKIILSEKRYIVE